MQFYFSGLFPWIIALPNLLEASMNFENVAILMKKSARI